MQGQSAPTKPGSPSTDSNTERLVRLGRVQQRWGDDSSQMTVEMPVRKPYRLNAEKKKTDSLLPLTEKPDIQEQFF